LALNAENSAIALSISLMASPPGFYGYFLASVIARFKSAMLRKKCEKARHYN
jgi:hypothetical protein